MTRLALILALFLAACDDGSSPPVRQAQAPDPSVVIAWEIGPTIPPDPKYHYAGENFSVNMPLHPTKAADGWAFEFGPNAEPHYITTATGPLTDKSAITLRYRVEAAPGTVIYPKDKSGPSLIALYFQRCGEIRFDKEGYRWYSAERQSPIEIGEHVLTEPLSGRWGSVFAYTSTDNPGAFALSLKETCRIGFVMGGPGGLGHGVRATAPVRFVVTGFEAL